MSGFATSGRRAKSLASFRPKNREKRLIVQIPLLWVYVAPPSRNCNRLMRPPHLRRVTPIELVQSVEHQGHLGFGNRRRAAGFKAILRRWPKDEGLEPVVEGPAMTSWYPAVGKAKTLVNVEVRDRVSPRNLDPSSMRPGDANDLPYLARAALLLRAISDRCAPSRNSLASQPHLQGFY